MNIRCILFDIGHVLVDLRGAEIIRGFAKHDLSISQINETWLNIESVRSFETGNCDAMAFADGVISFYHLDTTAKVFISGIESAVKGKYDGVDAVLERLKNSNSVSCITNTNPIQWPIINDLLDADDIFDESILSYEVGIMKPSKGIFKLAIERVGFDPSEILFIDDNLANIEAGRKCGLVCEQAEGIRAVQRIERKYTGTSLTR